jgi:hypothetical protein
VKAKVKVKVEVKVEVQVEDEVGPIRVRRLPHQEAFQIAD